MKQTVWIYSRRSNDAAADALADTLRAAGHKVRRGATKHYRGEMHTDADVIHHDGSAPMLVSLHEGKVELRGLDGETTAAEPVIEAAPEATQPDPEPESLDIPVG